jgi:hypothetical protein
MPHETNPDDQSMDWKRGYQAGVRKTKSSIWGAVYDYVHRHSPEKAEALKEAVVQSLNGIDGR